MAAKTKASFLQPLIMSHRMDGWMDLFNITNYDLFNITKDKFYTIILCRSKIPIST